MAPRTEATLNTRDRYQWLGVKHQFGSLYHDRQRADDALREAHVRWISESESGLKRADLDSDASTKDSARREAAIEREWVRRRRQA